MSHVLPQRHQLNQLTIRSVLLLDEAKSFCFIKYMNFLSCIRIPQSNCFIVRWSCYHVAIWRKSVKCECRLSGVYRNLMVMPVFSLRFSSFPISCNTYLADRTQFVCPVKERTNLWRTAVHNFAVLSSEAVRTLKRKRNITLNWKDFDTLDNKSNYWGSFCDSFRFP